MHIRVFPEHSCIGLRCSYKKMTAKKKPSIFDILCLCFSFIYCIMGIVLYRFKSIQFLPRLITFSAQCYFVGWLRLVLFVIRMACDTDNPLLVLVAQSFCISHAALPGVDVLFWRLKAPSVVVVGQVLGFIGVWTCYGILRFALFLDKCIKAFFARSFILAWLSFQIQRLIGKKENL